MSNGISATSPGSDNIIQPSQSPLEPPLASASSGLSDPISPSKSIEPEHLLSKPMSSKPKAESSSPVSSSSNSALAPTASSPPASGPEQSAQNYENHFNVTMRGVYDSPSVQKLVATFCAIDVILCIRLFSKTTHARTIFGLLFSICGLVGSVSRKKGMVLMYVIHTSFTCVRGVIHTFGLLVTLSHSTAKCSDILSMIAAATSLPSISSSIGEVVSSASSVLSSAASASASSSSLSFTNPNNQIFGNPQFNSLANELNIDTQAGVYGALNHAHTAPLCGEGHSLLSVSLLLILQSLEFLIAYIAYSFFCSLPEEGAEELFEKRKASILNGTAMAAIASPPAGDIHSLTLPSSSSSASSSSSVHNQSINSVLSSSSLAPHSKLPHHGQLPSLSMRGGKGKFSKR